MLKLVSKIVEGEGYLVAPARDGKEAYHALRSGANIVLAIVDVLMPYIEGTQLVSFMRSNEGLRSIPVIMMTGEKSFHAGAVSLSSGATAFLIKPFTNEQLRNTVRTLAGQIGLG